MLEQVVLSQQNVGKSRRNFRYHDRQRVVCQRIIEVVLETRLLPSSPVCRSFYSLTPTNIRTTRLKEG